MPKQNVRLLPFKTMYEKVRAVVRTYPVNREQNLLCFSLLS